MTIRLEYLLWEHWTCCMDIEGHSGVEMLQINIDSEKMKTSTRSEGPYHLKRGRPTKSRIGRNCYGGPWLMDCRGL